MGRLAELSVSIIVQEILRGLDIVPIQFVEDNIHIRLALLKLTHQVWIINNTLTRRRVVKGTISHIEIFSVDSYYPVAPQIECLIKNIMLISVISKR
ncbi:hypothetical protein SAMN05192555_11022 [Franzmannia pantelleriensis]|uniref:Uncharacterized protein n=1 Tax=Franzmannia pantelleriensis TaxID=48727 RepID=A0A1G9R2N4_9GAMM|nr:hypothetical protein SAMN05192555_11022 [Halomonas pantelleriensis]